MKNLQRFDIKDGILIDSYEGRLVKYNDVLDFIQFLRKEIKEIKETLEVRS
jgi:hypothetical protein